jgi:hypothetical protein
MLERGGAPQEPELEPDRDHGFRGRGQATVGIGAGIRAEIGIGAGIGAGDLAEHLLIEVERPESDRADQVIPGGVVLMQRGPANASRFRHLGQRRRRIRHQHLRRHIEQRSSPNNHVHNSTILILPGQAGSHRDLRVLPGCGGGRGGWPVLGRDGATARI